MFSLSVQDTVRGATDGLVVKNPPANAGDLGSEDPLEKEWQPTPAFLPGESHGQRSLVGYSPWGCKELDTTERLHFTSLHDAGFEDIRRQP